MQTIDAELYTTGTEKKALLLKARAIKRQNEKRHIIMYVDKSGSMHTSMTQGDMPHYDPQYDPNATPGVFSAPMPVMPADDAPPPLSQLRAVATQSYDPYATPAAYPTPPMLRPTQTQGSRAYESRIDPGSRLGVVLSFIEKILDMLISMEDVDTDITIIAFDNYSEVFSTLDESGTRVDVLNKIRLGVRRSFMSNGGTDFDCLEKVGIYKQKYREKMGMDVDSSVLFLSDGETDDKHTIVKKYFKLVDLGIGVGEQGVDVPTMSAISKTFHCASKPEQIRDLVSEWFWGIVTMLGRNLTLEPVGDESHIFYTNMNLVVDEDGNRKYVWPRFSLLMNLYATVSPGTYKLTYTLHSGEEVSTIITDVVIPDTSFGDKVDFTLQILEKLDDMKETDGMSAQCKTDYIKSIQEFIDRSEHLSTFVDTSIGIYCRQLQNQVAILATSSLPPDEKRFRELLKNVKTDAYRSASSVAADTLSPAPSTPLLAVSSSVSSSNNACLLSGGNCSDVRTIIYQPCGHFRTCKDCSMDWDKQSAIKKCPYCNIPYTGFIEVVLSPEQNQDSWNMKCSCKRKLQVYSRKCKHIFSCKSCIADQQKTGKVCCTICGVESDGSDLLDKIFM